MVRWKLARALGAACRQLWRRNDLSSSDEIVCDLVAEALARVSRQLRGPAGAPARAILECAPPDKKLAVLLLAGIATRQSKKDGLVLAKTAITAHQEDWRKISLVDLLGPAVVPAPRPV